MIFEQFDYKSQIIDISALAAGYKDVQPLGEQLIKSLWISKLYL